MLESIFNKIAGLGETPTRVFFQEFLSKSTYFEEHL